MRRVAVTAASACLAVAAAPAATASSSSSSTELSALRRLQSAPSSACPESGYEPGQITAQFAVPMCMACIAISLSTLSAAEACRYDVSECAAVEPGKTCLVRCRPPFTGAATEASCPAGNYYQAQPLYSLPTCTCPEPIPSTGYVRATGHSSGSGWECASGYHGTPVVMCEATGTCTATDNEVSSWLVGCKPLAPCVAPVVDPCRYDVSACLSVQPGQTCQVQCKAPLIGQPRTAKCLDMNTDPDRELEYPSLNCMLEQCPDPRPWPPGYNKTASGTWTCADDHTGTAVNRCVPSTDWSPGLGCKAVSVLEGCLPIVPCVSVELTGIDVCMYELSSCQNLAPGATCEVFCKAPFVGVSTAGNFCPATNTNRQGLQWVKPQCVLQECDDPPPPTGYIKTDTGLQCAESYSGFAQKVCKATETCEVVPTVEGCAQVFPCEAPSTDCKYDVSDCASVQPGSSCRIGCRAPFSGGTSVGNCLSGNTDRFGLQVSSWPTCTVDTCADPGQPWPMGYTKSGGAWRCASGYAGTVKKRCELQEAQCSFNAVLSGCFRTETCTALNLTTEAERCKYNVSKCRSVNAGSSCQVSCRAPSYVGSPTPATCPTGNTELGQELVWSPPSCDCRDPAARKGYNKTVDGWSCASGFAGSARKMCNVGAGCSVEPTLVGCSVPVSCEVEPFLPSAESHQQAVSGTLRFGPAVLDAAVREEEVLEYRVYFADRCGQPLGNTIAVVPKTSMAKPCCRSNAYSASVRATAPPLGTEGLTVVVHTLTGDAPSGRFLSLNPTSLPPMKAQVSSACYAAFLGSILATFAGCVATATHGIA